MKGHEASYCKSEKNCRYCNKRHYQSICDQVHTKVHVSVLEENTTNESETTSATTGTNANVSKQPKTVLLQTARAVALEETGETSTSVRILFDTGSQRSYITENLRSKLKLKSVQQERLNLNTFGNNHFKSQKCDLERLQLKSYGLCSDETISISALTFPTNVLHYLQE